MTAGALLTWIAGGFVALLGTTLLAATLTGNTGLAQALARTAGLSSTASASSYPVMAVLLIVAGVLPAALAVAAFHRSRAGLVGLTIAAGAYAVLAVLVVLDLGQGLTSLLGALFGMCWVGLVIALFRRRKDWYTPARPAPETGPARAVTASATAPPRPGRLVGGAVLVWLAGAAVLLVGARLAWSGFTALQDPSSTAMLPTLSAGLGLAFGAVGVALLVLTSTTFAGSLDTLVALTVVGLIVLAVFLVATAAADNVGVTIILDVFGIGWLTAAAVLLWSRSSRDWYASRGR